MKKALIFVYTSAQFRVSGGTVRPFPHGKPSSEPRGANEVRLTKGIYGVFPTSPKEDVKLDATLGTVGTDYDTTGSDGKDIWTDPKILTFYNNAHQAFLGLDDDQLTTFIDGRSA